MTDLPWLPAAATEFRSEVRALPDAPAWEAAVRRLATSRMNLTQLHTLARAIQRNSVQAALPWLKLSILSNATVDLLVPAIVATGPRHDLWLDVQSSAYGVYTQEALDPQSATNLRRSDFVVLAIDHRGLHMPPCPGEAAQAERVVEAALQTVRDLAAALNTGSGTTVIVQTLPRPFETLFGNLDGRLPGTPQWLIERFNQRLRDSTQQGTLLLDVAALAETVGYGQWHDPVQWNMGKFPFSPAAVPLYADWLCRVIAAVRGKSKKCLVLDLDNTLWGGVVGDDGLSGIVLGQGDPQGEAYLAVQAAALALRERGIVLAVSSKNDEANARQVFREHPEMLLREEHIAVFQANWEDKATNLRAIAATLNIGVDALVLLDDNPAERQQIRLALPAVGVPELPEHPEWFATILLSAGYFESVQFTADDKERAAQYQANAARSATLGASTNLDAYLDSLSMEVQFAPFNAVGRARITQLINKTNQFNLTTRRYSEAEIAALENDPAAFTLQVRLKDRFGDNGMVCVVICRQQDDDWLVDTWLMSCRVLNRRLEEEVLNTVMSFARNRSVRRLIGMFRPTKKNDMVKEHYARLGFSLESESAERAEWTFEVARYRPRSTPMRVIMDKDLLNSANAVVD